MYQYKRLRDLREDADKTQKQIGALLHTTQQQYAKYESGVQEIPVHHLLCLAEFYGVSTDYLLGRISTGEEALWNSMRAARGLEPLNPESAPKPQK